MSEAPKSMVDRVTAEADKYRLLRALKWLIVAPFYAVGVLVAVVWVLGALAVGAVAVGVRETRGRLRPAPAKPPKADG